MIQIQIQTFIGRPQAPVAIMTSRRKLKCIGRCQNKDTSKISARCFTLITHAYKHIPTHAFMFTWTRQTKIEALRCASVTKLVRCWRRRSKMSPQVATEPRDGQLPQVVRHGVVQSWPTAGKTAPPHLRTRPGDGQLIMPSNSHSRWTITDYFLNYLDYTRTFNYLALLTVKDAYDWLTTNCFNTQDWQMNITISGQIRSDHRSDREPGITAEVPVADLEMARPAALVSSSNVRRCHPVGHWRPLSPARPHVHFLGARSGLVPM